MASGEPCGVCGETETKLVDGYYYCAECGTQDTRLQETIVEYQVLADGTNAIGRRTRYSVKIKDGMEMSPEWYKWHKNNFLLAGLTEQLVELGAAPSVRMKVLWIWTRYIKLFQKKGEMGPKQPINQLENSSSSEDEKKDLEEEDGEEGEEDMAALARKGVLKLDRVSGYVVVAILALALNIDRSPVLVSHVKRWARLRLLSVADVFRLVPAEVLACCGRLGYSPARAYHAIPVVMARMTKLLSLGGPVAPDMDALLASQLRELRLPRALAALVRALVRLAPAPAHAHARRRGGPDEESRDESRFPDYEAMLMAYVVVALKLCFGLDDECERRLADAVQRVNREARHPRARLFSFRSWARHMRLRARTLARTVAPAGWARAEHAAGAGRAAHAHAAALAQLQEFTSARAERPAGARGLRKGAKTRVTDQVTMEILGKIPARFDAGAPSLAELRPAAAALEPQAALTRAVGGRLPPAQARLLDEDFTEYDVEYAFRRLSLPGLQGEHLFRGVRPRACAGKKVGDQIYNSIADPSTVYVKNCSNRHWAKTRRPTAEHVVDAYGSGSQEEGEGERGTFVEEDEGRCIFDDDFSYIAIKEEKPDFEDDVRVSVEDSKDVTNWIDSFAHFETENKSDDEVPDIFDSDDEVVPQFNPSTFRREEVIKEIMAASYKRLVVRPPIRFQTEKTLYKKRKYKPEHKTREYRFGVDNQVWANKLRAQEERAAVEDLVATYRDNLHRDVLHQVEQQVRAFTAAAAEELDAPEPEPEPVDPGHADPVDADDGDVEIIEEDKKDDNNDDDSTEEHAYDPILKSDAKFDENSHDIHQLYLKMAAPPPEESYELFDDDVVAILDERIRRRKIPKGKKKEHKVINTDIDHLVDEPDRITAFRYWFAQPQQSKTHCFIKQRRKFEREIEEWSPRSFWFVLTECAAALDMWPARLYARVVAVEAQLLRLLPKRDGPRPAMGRPRKDKGPARVSNRNRTRDVDDDLSVAGDSRDGKAGSEDDTSLWEHGEKLTKAGYPLEGKSETGGREKSGEPMIGNISEASDSEDASSSEDQNYRRPKEKGKPRKHISKTSDSNDTTEWRPETYNSEGETSFSEDTERPKKRVNSRKSVDGDFSKAKASRNWSRIRSLKSSEGDTSSSEVEKEPRIKVKSRETLEGCFSDSSDARERRPDRPSTGSERDTSLSDDQEEPRKKGRPRKNKNGDVLEACGLRHQTDLSEPNKRGRPRKYLDSSLQRGSNSQRHEHPRKRGKPRKDESPIRERENIPQEVNRNLSEEISRLNTPERPSTCLDSHEEDEINSQNKWKSGRKSGDDLGDLSETSDSKDVRPERSNKYLDEDTSTSESSENQEPSRKRGRPRKSVDQDLPESNYKHNTTPKISSPTSAKTQDVCVTLHNTDKPKKRDTSHQDAEENLPGAGVSQKRVDRPSLELDSKLQTDSSTSSCQNVSKTRERPLKSVDGNLPKASEPRERNSREPRVLRKTKSKKSSSYFDWRHLHNASTPQNQEQHRKRKYAPGEVSGANILKKIPVTQSTLASRLQDGRCSSGDPPKRGRGRPSKYVDWRLLQNASTPQSREQPWRREPLGKHIPSFPGDLSAIQTLPQGASVSQKDTTEEPLLTESRVISFDKF